MPQIIIEQVFLLDTIGKVYAAVVDSTLRSHLDKKLDWSQNDFREGISTDQALLGVRLLFETLLPNTILLF